jgi:transposase
MNDSDRPASAIAMELGIRRNQLYKWKEQMDKKGDVASSKKGRPKKEEQSEVARLRQENKRLEAERQGSEVRRKCSHLAFIPNTQGFPCKMNLQKQE